MLLYSVTQESEPVKTGSSGLIVKKEKHVLLLLNLVLSFELKFPATHRGRGDEGVIIPFCGLLRSGKSQGITYFFCTVREKSGNFASSQKIS